MGKRRKYGMTEQEVYNHLDGFHSIDAKIGFLWKVIDKRDLITENTETPVLNVLKRLYFSQYQENRFEESTIDKQYLGLSDFGRKLITKGFVSQGNKAIEEAGNLLERYVDGERPERNHFERYTTHSSFYGCGYEDSTTRYDGFNDKGYEKAWESYRNLLVSYSKFDKTKPSSSEENSNKDELIPYLNMIRHSNNSIEELELRPKLKELEARLGIIKKEKSNRRCGIFNKSIDLEKLAENLKLVINNEIDERTKRLDYDGLNKAYELKETLEYSKSRYDQEEYDYENTRSYITYRGFVLIPNTHFPKNGFYKELDKKRKEYQKITKPFLDGLVANGKYITAKRLGKDLDNALNIAKKARRKVKND